MAGWKTELVADKGKVLCRAFQLEEGQQVILGRAEDVDVQILDAGLSRHHCVLQRQGDVFVLRDLDSRNGTFVNGARIKESALKAGDRIDLGGLKFQFRVEPDRRRQPANLIASYPEKATPDFREKIDLNESGLMQLPQEFQNLENYKRIQRDLSTIYKVGNLIHSETHLKRLYERIADAIFDVTSGDRCGLLVEGPDRGPLRIAAVRVRQGLPPQDAPAFSQTIVDQAHRDGVSVIGSDAMTDDRFNRAESVILQDIRSVMCVPLEDRDRRFGVIYVDTIGRSEAFRRHEVELLTAIGKQAGIAIRRAMLVTEVENLLRGTTRALVAAIEAKDQYTRGHSERVTEYSLAVARALGVAEEELKTLELAGVLHDIGKIGVSEDVLNKRGPLNDAEWDILHRHPSVGADIIANIETSGGIARIVRHHHERWDGAGYPEGLAGEAIPYLARILSAADAFDAMTSARPYRKALAAETAVGELRDGAGTQFDSAVVEAFCSEFEKGNLQAVTKMSLA